MGLPEQWLLREIFGILIMIGYLFVLPVALAKLKYVRHYYEQMGPARYYVGMSLFLIMMLLPLKMYLRWAINLKYIIHIQEFFFNV